MSHESDKSTKSWPSQAVASVDVPNPRNLSAQFEYFRYTIDETSDVDTAYQNEAGLAGAWQQGEAGHPSSKTLYAGMATKEEIQSHAPRAVVLRWHHPQNTDITAPPNELKLIQRMREALKPTPKPPYPEWDGTSQINDEAHTGSPGFVGIGINDPAYASADQKLIMFLMSTSGEMNDILDSSGGGDVLNIDATKLDNALTAFFSKHGIANSPNAGLAGSIKDYFFELCANPTMTYGQVDYYKMMTGKEDSLKSDLSSGVSATAPPIMNLQVNNVLAPHVFLRGTSVMGRLSGTWHDSYAAAKKSYEESIANFTPGELLLSGIKSTIVPWDPIDTTSFPAPELVDISNISEAFNIIENDKPTILAYMIVGYELTDAGTPDFNTERVIFTSPTKIEARDTLVKYGKRYTYTVHSIAVASMIAAVEGQGKYKKIKALIKSNPSNSVVLLCKDTKYTPPPADMVFKWDYGYIRQKDRKRGRLLIEWNMPVNPENDIKYFQIYRRSSVAHPFELMAEYDFNDSVDGGDHAASNVVLGYPEEKPEELSHLSMPSLRRKRKDPTSPKANEGPLKDLKYKARKIMITRYADYEFTKGSVYIYTMVCIDAHGNFSNYSPQYGVWFDTDKNEIVVDNVSPSGAPMPHPNWFLNPSIVMSRQSGHYLSGMTWGNDSVYPVPDWAKTLDAASKGAALSNITVDCIKTSKHNKINLYLDPDAMNVYTSDAEGSINGMSVLAYSASHVGMPNSDDKTFSVGSYQMHLINVDRGKSKLIDIFIDEQRDKIYQPGSDAPDAVPPYWISDNAKYTKFNNWPGG
jgi:hypothetical protein